MSSLMSDRLAIVSVIDPDDFASGTTLGDVIDMRYHEELMFIVLAGDLNTACTIDLKVTQSTASGGTFTPISGKSITQITEASSTQDDSQSIINLKASELSSGYRFVKARLLIGGVGGTGVKSGVAVLTLASRTRFSDAVYTTTFGDLLRCWRSWPKATYR